jgi:hypothetical protein
VRKPTSHEEGISARIRERVARTLCALVLPLQWDRQNQCELWAAQCHARPLVVEYDGAAPVVSHSSRSGHFRVDVCSSTAIVRLPVPEVSSDTIQLVLRLVPIVDELRVRHRWHWSRRLRSDFRRNLGGRVFRQMTPSPARMGHGSGSYTADAAWP